MANKTEKEIFKFQRPLDGGKNVLIYNENRSIMLVEEMTKRQMRDLFWGNEPKVYCLCSYTPPRSALMIEKIVEDQDW